MSKVNVKQIHALIDELADAGQSEMLTALHVIMMNAAKSAADDSDLDLEDDEKPAKKSGKTVKKSGRKVRRAAAEDDSDDGEDDADGEDDSDDGDDADDLEGLDGLDDLDVDGEDEKPARGKKPKKTSKKAAAEEDDEDDADDSDDEAGDAPEWTPGKKPAATFEKFLDEVDAFEFEANSGGVRELNAAIQAYGINPNEMDFELDDLEGRELRKAKQEAFGVFLTRLEHIEEALIEAGEDVIEKIADHYEVETDAIKGRGKAKMQKIAAAIIGAIYADEDSDE